VGLKLIDLRSSGVKEITEELQKYGDVIKGLHDQAGDLSVQVCIEIEKRDRQFIVLLIGCLIV